MLAGSAVVMASSLPAVEKPTRRAFRDHRASSDTCVAEHTFADVATRYLERHVRRHLVPRAYVLALYAHTFSSHRRDPSPERRHGLVSREAISSDHDRAVMAAMTQRIRETSARIEATSSAGVMQLGKRWTLQVLRESTGC
jgi:hypothetical protein